MTRPLELTVYPLSPRNDGTLYSDYFPGADGPVPHWIADAYAKGKRFTDAEMSAELLRQTAWLGALGRTYKADEGRNIIIEAAFTFGPITRDEHEWWVIAGFATHPHYDEDSE